MKSSLYIKRIFQYAALLVWAVIAIGPFIWMLLSSFKPLNEVITWPPKLIPEHLTFDNYVRAWTIIPYSRYLLNSMMIASVSTLSVIVSSCLAAYSIVVLRSKLSFIVNTMILIGLIMPAQISFIPMFSFARRFGLIDSYMGLLMPYLTSAFGVFLMSSFFKMLPFDLLDAARIDGLGEMGIVLRLVIPLAKPGIVTLMIFTFMGVWRDFFWPMLLINKTYLRTVPIGLQAFYQMESQHWGQNLAASVISIIPLLVIYLIFQKQFRQGIAYSGLKM
ncbi:MAG: carbohydrate ABC transporter permease [Clostridia bacterium]|nr:carbohydrate ABC transporter permease [Clostridia bacterium]